MKKILIISMLLISSPLFSGHHAKGEMSNAEVVKKAYATFGSLVILRAGKNFTHQI